MNFDVTKQTHQFEFLSGEEAFTNITFHRKVIDLIFILWNMLKSWMLTSTPGFLDMWKEKKNWKITKNDAQEEEK